MKEYDIHVVKGDDVTTDANLICKVRIHEDGKRDLYIPDLTEFPTFMEEDFDGWVGGEAERTELETQRAPETGSAGSNPAPTTKIAGD